MAQDMLTKVRALLDTAESFLRDGNGEAAASYQAKAEEIMKKYRIEEEEALAKDPTSLSPISTTVVVCSYFSEFRDQYISMLAYAADHCGVMYDLQTRRQTDHAFEVTATLVGYENDLGYAEALFTAARLVFMENLEPTVDSSLTVEMNCYRLRAAGKTRREVAQLVFGNTDKVSMGRVGRYYKAECAKRGVPAALDGKGVQGAQYRDSYSRQFTFTFYDRLYRARSSNGGGMVLAGREERVKEAFYEKCPHRRPTPKVVDNTPTMAEVRANCPKCQRAQSGACREHPYPKAGRAPKDNYHSAAAIRGRRAGASAARDISIRGDRTESLEG